MPLTLPFFSDDLDRRDEEFDLDPFLFRRDDLLDGRGHVLALAAVEDGHVGAETGRAAGRVDGGVAAADDRHLRAEGLFALCPGAFVGVEIPEELDAAVDALELLAGDAHLLALVGAGGQIDVVELFADLREGDVFADARLAFDLHAEGADIVDLLGDDVARQTVGGNRPAEHAARLGELFEDRDLVAAQGQIPGGRQPGRTGADDGDLLLAGDGNGLDLRAAGRCR